MVSYELTMTSCVIEKLHTWASDSESVLVGTDVVVAT